MLLGLGGVAGAATMATWPRFIRRAFASNESCEIGPEPVILPDPGDVTDIGSAAHRAKATGRALLVLVIPQDDGQKYERGHLFGELLNHGSDADLAPLARADVMCATLAEVQKIAPTAKGEPLMFAIDVRAKPAQAAPLDAAVPKLSGFGDSMTWEERDQHDAQAIEKRINMLAGLIRRGLGPTPAAQIAADAKRVRATLVDKPVVGSKWARTHGCGTDVEGQPPMIVGCGMGHVPDKSSRFLYFFADEQVL
jgi:hypothetical protein